MGRRESGEASDAEALLLRVLTPVAKLVTGKQAVAVASEALEAFGGAGYVEDTGLPRLLRDAQVLPIWEGTTNVLSLDLLRALAAPGAAEALRGEVDRLVAAVAAPSLREPVDAARRAVRHAEAWLAATTSPEVREAGARRFATTLGRSLEALLLAAHGQWCLDRGRGERAAAAARRLAREGLDRVVEGASPEDAALLSAVP
jgi:hypothetical protein